MNQPLFATAVLGAALLVPVVGGTTDSPLQTAELAWDRGDYAVALRTYLSILASPDADSAFESIALQTGELYRPIELTPDGALPQFSPDGRYITYETGTLAQRQIRLLLTDQPDRNLAELRGWAASFSPDSSQLAYLKTVDAPEVAAAQAAFDKATAAERTQRLTALNQALDISARLTIRDLASGRETDLDTGALRKASLMFGAGGAVIFAGTPAGTDAAQIYSAAEGRGATALTDGETEKVLSAINSTGTAVLFTTRQPGAGRGGRGAGGGSAGALATTFNVLSLPEGKTTTVNGSSPAFSGDGRTIVFINRSSDENRVMRTSTADPGTPVAVRKGPERIDSPAASADGSQIAFQMMTRDDWEIFVVDTREGGGETRLTRDIQHDLLPQFLTADRLLAIIGEPRHRRSFLYDLPSAKRTRLFHNNTVRTIAPEYSWEPNPDGTKVLIVAERDGDTVSTARGIYLMDLSRKITLTELKTRVEANLAAEEALRSKSLGLYSQIADPVKAMLAEASVERVYTYEKALFDFDSKHISRPGNRLASAYLFETYKSFGYAPEYQWLERTNALGGKTANVIATLKGTVNPELIYVVSSHYDSVAVGPGADDDSSGTAALLETARIMASRPQAATIVFASFTGEEAGLLGSREFVRRAVADKQRIVGALNNDMVGWANDFRLDNTIRYSNPGIRDIQHAAAIQFTKLITYDSLYYKGTDAAAYYEAFGDIVGGIGSYPVLSSPHYHQPHDVLENMNHQLITEVAKTTAATLMLLASSPSRLVGLKVDRFSGGSATLSWTPSPEQGVDGYIVAYGPPAKPEERRQSVPNPTVTLPNISPGTIVSVKAVSKKGFEGWDWARVVVW
jgi:Peptidase family M28/Fibronectin type III domain/WD40-like Beta Propeller Repeat